MHGGVGCAIIRKAHAVALEHRAGARVGVHVTVPRGINLQADVTLLMLIPVVPTVWHWGSVHALLHSPGIARPQEQNMWGPLECFQASKATYQAAPAGVNCIRPGRAKSGARYLELEEQALKGVPDVLCESHIPRVRIAIHAVRIEGPVKACARERSLVFLPSHTATCIAECLSALRLPPTSTKQQNGPAQDHHAITSASCSCAHLLSAREFCACPRP